MYFLDERFLAVMPIAIAVYWASGSARNAVLLVVNVVWLALFSPPTLVALGALTVAVIYPVSQIASRLRATDEPRARRIGIAGTVVLIAVATTLRLRTYFLPDETLSSLPLGTELLQWIGFSYFVLKGIHVMLASSRGIISSTTPTTLLQYMLFLPTLTSGPLYRLDDFTKQLEAPKSLGWEGLHRGLGRILLGMAKKVIAVPILAAVLGAARARGVIWQPASFVAIYVMLFLDFSGYSDIAVGTGLLFGFQVPENFKNPFTSTTLTQFWRNWHASLGDWVRENVFIPFGGVRAKGWKLAAIVVGSMVIVGLWHGYAVVFVSWGLYHGIALLVENRLDIKPLRRHNTPRWRLWLRYAAIQIAVIAGMFAFLYG